jgi:hypothetical protein
MAEKPRPPLPRLIRAQELAGSELARRLVQFSSDVWTYLAGFAAEYDTAQSTLDTWQDREQARTLIRVSLRG